MYTYAIISKRSHAIIFGVKHNETKNGIRFHPTNRVEMYTKYKYASNLLQIFPRFVK